VNRKLTQYFLHKIKKWLGQIMNPVEQTDKKSKGKKKEVAAPSSKWRQLYGDHRRMMGDYNS
jgi:hypothetical protein